MKFILVLISFTCIAVTSFSQDMTKFKLYSPVENAAKSIDLSVKKAKKEGKHVLIQIGGNWCIWCARFNDFVTKDAKIDSVIQSSYVVYHLNYSKENKNADLLKKYAFPQRFGFPVFLVLDSKGALVHTQNSSYLESGKGYDREKVVGFLSDWTTKSLDPVQYKEKD